jgi:hypothetical protein
MAVSYNQSLGGWQVNGRGGYPTQAAAQAAEGSATAAPASTEPFAGTAGTTGPNTSVRAAGPVYDPTTDPNRQRVSGYQGSTRNNPTGMLDPNAPRAGATGAWDAGSDATRAGYQKMHDDAQGVQIPWERIVTGVATGGLSEVSRAAGLPLDSITGTKKLFEAGNDVFGRPGEGVRPGPGMPASAGVAAAGQGHGVAPPGAGGGAGGEIPPGAAGGGGGAGALGPPPGFATFDRSGYTQAKEDLDLARNTFLSELDRLSGVDPFGNQAFLQKATDRAVAQAAGTGAMARGGAAALAGAQRQTQGVQAQTAARGAQDMEQVRSRDEVMAGQLRGQNAAGLSQLATQRAGLEVEVAAKETETLQKNLDQWIQYSGITLPLAQSDVENLRQMALGYAQIDMDRYKTDVGYQANVDDNLTQRYGIDANKAVELKKIAASENMSFGEFLQGAMGAAAGVASVAMSDRRVKTDVRDPDIRDLQDFLGNTKGKLYRYKDPKHPGQRAGENYGPMAQDLQKSKIGRTVVVEGPGGLYVDTGRLALADHAALAELARDVEKLKKRTGKRK